MKKLGLGKIVVKTPTEYSQLTLKLIGDRHFRASWHCFTRILTIPQVIVGLVYFSVYLPDFIHFTYTLGA